jgi:UDP-N-acetylglucosamine--N-acetylmuramyl-(pentapeptide) pyrophosphoryl-undecaprenol N-acetylglucosamine transferase
MVSSGQKVAVLAAGGTGGHLFPAQALAEELSARGWTIHLMTDERVHDYGKDFPAVATHIIHAATLSLSDPLRLPSRMMRLYRGYSAAKAKLRELAPKAIIGFGGYPSLPPLLAATHVGVPSMVHEQNSVLGRANRLLSTRVTAVATSFAEVRNVPESAKSRFVLTGNPVRGVVKQVAGAPYPILTSNSSINMLVFGGSQGARVFADIMPPTIANIPQGLRERLHITQQCRVEDMDRVKAAYVAAGVKADLNPFYGDMPQRMARSHLVICRSGASSIAELGVVGRPAVLVPLPHALDNDQLRNAQSFEAAKAGWVHEQKTLEPQAFAQILERLLSNPVGLKEAAAAALAHGKPDAARQLATLVEQIAAGQAPAKTETTLS